MISVIKYRQFVVSCSVIQPVFFIHVHTLVSPFLSFCVYRSDSLYTTILHQYIPCPS